MTGQILFFGTSKVLEANGASITNNSIAQANDSNYGIVADGANYPNAKFVFSGAFATATGIENKTIGLYARPLNIKGVNDSEVPEAIRPTVRIGFFVLNDVTTTQYIELMAYDVPWEAEYYIHNNGIGQTLSAGWTLDVVPFSSGIA
jgi:hypothetical protein